MGPNIVQLLEYTNILIGNALLKAKTNNCYSIAVVIPCYKVTKHILGVIGSIGPEIDHIYVVDDACPENTGRIVQKECYDSRVSVIFSQKNQGVGGAVMTGYQAAIDAGYDIIVKLDGDGQMDPALIEQFIEPIMSGTADYTKGNRFFNLEEISAMPKVRLFGNAGLSFLTKISSGYWDLFDPTNGYTAIRSSVASILPFGKISQRYFFETDMLFRLNIARAVVVDVPMNARYGDEISNLKISKVIGEFFIKNIKNFIKRIFYNYYLRDMSIASLELPIGLFLLIFGGVFGISNWISSARAGIATSAGTVMIVGMSLIMGLQLILAFFAYDISIVPRRPLGGRKSSLLSLSKSSSESV